MRAQLGGSYITILILVGVIVGLALIIGHLASVTPTNPPALASSIYSGSYVNSNSQPYASGTFGPVQSSYASGLIINSFAIEQNSSGFYYNYSVVYSVMNCNYQTGSCPNSVGQVTGAGANIYITQTNSSKLVNYINGLMSNELPGINASIASATASEQNVANPTAWQYQATSDSQVKQIILNAIAYNRGQVVSTTTTTSDTTTQSTVPPSGVGSSVTTTIINSTGSSAPQQNGIIQGIENFFAWLSSLLTQKV